MTRLFAGILVMLALPCLAFGQAAAQKAAPAQVQTAAQEVSALESAWIDATLTYDAAWFERQLADTFVNTDEEGVVTGKAAMVADVKSRANVYETITYDDMKVHAYGDTAIATGIAVLEGTSKGKPIDSSSRWTNTWIKRAGQWQCVASQSTVIAKK